MHYYPIIVLSASWIFWLWDTYLNIRQYRVCKNTKSAPKEVEDRYDERTFLKAKEYSLDKAKFGFISNLFSQIQSSLILYYYLIPYLWNVSATIMTSYFGLSRSETLEWEIFQSLVFVMITSILSVIVQLPLSIYNTFVIEERHGFNKQTAGFYAWDKLKQFVVSYMITAPVLAAIVMIVRKGGPYFFLYLWLFCFVVVCVLTFFHGEIAALFDKFIPLSEGVLRDRIEEMAKKLNFPLNNIFIVEGSKRSAHSNAYQSGIFNRKRIVIYDTLIRGYYDDQKSKEDVDNKKVDTDKTENKQEIKGCDHDEIIAVLCHELGHWHCSHLWKNLTFVEINYFFMFMIFSRFYNDPQFYAAFGFSDEMPIIIGFALLMMVLTPYNEILGFLATLMSRHFEYEADDFASKLGHSENLKTALIKLSTDNLGFPVHDELYSTFNHSHPTLIQRLKALSKSQ